MSGTFGSIGANLIDIGDGSGGFRGSVQVGTAAAPINPLLGALAFNGGPTKTHKQTSSRAIDWGDNSFAPPIDQRGVVRPRDGNKDGSFIVDIGSFEF